MNAMVRAQGLLGGIRERWMPDQSLAIIAELEVSRPALGSERKHQQTTQPLPLRASGDIAKALASYAGKHVSLTGQLRRRVYQRDGQTHWGQLEIWVDDCQPYHIEEQR